jgi:hypothetical protein
MKFTDEQRSQMLTVEQRAHLMRIVDEISDLHAGLKDPALLPDELVDLFELMPVLCESMIYYTAACEGYGTITPMIATPM